MLDSWSAVDLTLVLLQVSFNKNLSLFDYNMYLNVVWFFVWIYTVITQKTNLSVELTRSSPSKISFIKNLFHLIIQNILKTKQKSNYIQIHIIIKSIILKFVSVQSYRTSTTAPPSLQSFHCFSSAILLLNQVCASQISDFCQNSLITRPK